MRVGFDIGGTFTDVIILDDHGRVEAAKLLSLLDRVGTDIAACVDETGRNQAVDTFIHGTTIASNALIEGKIARTAFIATQGFRDDLELRGQRRPSIFDINWERLPPLVPRDLRAEVSERIRSNGVVDKALDPVEAEAVVRRLVSEGVEAITVCLINSYVNPVHERELKELIEKIAPDIVCCISSEVHPEIREYERASTTAINASLIPVVRRYLDGLREALARHSEKILVMQSNGGIMTAQAARRRPIYMIESGPAAGVLAAAVLARESGFADALSLDMGGTTAKACLIENAAPLEKAGGEVGAGGNVASLLVGGRVSGAGYALRVPSFDIVEVGAGGGSIAWIDGGGALRVGPESAGADPGPACYGRGGRLPTVTDANVVLGYISPRGISRSNLSIDGQAAVEAIERELAHQLGLSPRDVAYGIIQVANATMMRALRAVSIERGRDPRTLTLIPFGGAGPLHAAQLAESLGIGRVHVPPFPGLFSALGLLLADFRVDYIRSMATTLDSVTSSLILTSYAEMEESALNELTEQGVTQDAIRFERWIDLKYAYQISELALLYPSSVPASELRSALAQLFTEAHKREFHHSPNLPIELVNLRLRAIGSVSGLQLSDLARQQQESQALADPRRRSAYFGPRLGVLECLTLSRSEVTGEMSGPLIVEEPDSTAVVPPGWAVHRDPVIDIMVLSRQSGSERMDRE